MTVRSMVSEAAMMTNVENRRLRILSLGAEIAQLVESDNWDAISAHCAWDVATRKALAEKFDVIRRRP